MQAFIVVMEYLGPSLGPRLPAPRAPACEHAYDLESGTVAGHPAAEQPRIGFPGEQRGWNSPPQTARCADCDVAVQRIVRDLIAAVVGALSGQLPRADWDPPTAGDPF